MKHHALLFSILGILGIVALDGALKFFAQQHFLPETDPSLSQIFALTFHQNPGITFDLPVPLLVVIPLTIMIVVGLLWHSYKRNVTLVHVGTFAICAGAMDNLIDRIVNGFTTDYLMIFHTSIINLADVLIVLGALLLFLYDRANPHTRHPSF